MQFGKRIGLFLLTNILVIASISIVLNLVGVHGYITQAGLDYQSLMIICLAWGMMGSFISLGLSRIMAKFMMGVKVIDPAQARGGDLELVQMIYRLAQGAGLSKMPEVGIYQSPELNAFATGPTKNRALVAVSSGILTRMTREELEGVLGHEITHIANGDMVTMTLIQGIVNAFVMFLSRVIAFFIMQALRGDRSERRGESSGFAYFGVQMALEIVFMIFGSLVVAWFSRRREFRADAGGARLAGQSAMVHALQKLQSTYEMIDPNGSGGAKSVQTLKISGRKSRMSLFSTHPPLDERIARLQASL